MSADNKERSNASETYPKKQIDPKTLRGLGSTAIKGSGVK